MATQTKQRQGFSLENATFYFSLALLAAVVGVFFYLGYSITQKEGELAQASAEVVKAKTGEQKQMEDRVFKARQSLGDFSKIMAERKTSAGFFGKFETLVLPEVYFFRCDLDLKKMTASLSGNAKTFQALGQQISLLEQSKDAIKGVNLGKVGINDEEGIDFGVSIDIGPDMVSFK